MRLTDYYVGGILGDDCTSPLTPAHTSSVRSSPSSSTFPMKVPTPQLMFLPPDMGEVFFNLREMDKEWLTVTTDGYAKRKAKGQVCVSCTRVSGADSASDKKKKSKKKSKG